MGVRKRGGVWHYQFQYRTETVCGTFPDAKSEEQALALEQEERLKAKLGVRDKRVDDDFEKFVKVYLRNSESKADYRHDVFRCAMLVEHFAGKRMRDIKQLDVERFIKARLASISSRGRKRSPVTVHKEVTLLSTVFNMAVAAKKAAENPCKQITKATRRMIRARNKRSCPMTPEKEQALFDKGLKGRYAHLMPVCRFDLETGLRLGELRRLEVSHVNLGRESLWFEVDGEHVEVPFDCFIVTKSKTGKPRVITMNAKSRAVAEHQINDVTVMKYLFPSSKTKGMLQEVKKGLRGACNQAGIKYGQNVPGGITFHSLRHWFSSKLEDLGVSKTVRRDLLGHQPRDITDDYTHSTIKMRRDAVNLLCQASPGNVLDLHLKSGISLAG
jgi:integrase